MTTVWLPDSATLYLVNHALVSLLVMLALAPAAAAAAAAAALAAAAAAAASIADACARQPGRNSDNNAHRVTILRTTSSGTVFRKSFNFNRADLMSRV